MSNQVQTFEEYVNSKKAASAEAEGSSKNPENSDASKGDVSEDGENKSYLSEECSEAMNKLIETMVSEMDHLDESKRESYVKESIAAFDTCKSKIQEVYEGSKKKEEPKKEETDTPKKEGEDKETEE